MRQADIKAGEEYTNGKRGRRLVLSVVYDPVYRCDRVMYEIVAGPTSNYHGGDSTCWCDLRSFARWAVARVEEPGR